jgi:hypothetical protein
LAGDEQYARDMAYLQRLANQGTVDRSNSIWQKLDGKRNIKAVDDFLNSILSKTVG